MAGFCQGGGVGLALTNWMVHGDPGSDIWAMDVARFGDWATRGYTNAKVRENYSRRFRIRFPNEELPAARPLRTTPIYDRLKQRGAVFGASFGLEHALWFAPSGGEANEDITFRRSNAHGPVGEECRAVRNAVGLIEISSYSKYAVTGPGAEAWLSKLLINHMPQTGRIVLAPMLNPHGKLIGDFTVAKLADEQFYLFGSGIAEGYHMRWFEAQLPKTGVAIRSLCSELTGFSIAGPTSRELLRRLAAADVSNEAFPFLSFRTMDLRSVPAMAGRVTFTGDLGYEIWVSADYQRTLYDLLIEAGRDLGLRHFGTRALNALRLEKGFGTWAREFRPIYGPFEAGLGRFVDFRKSDFIGRDAVLKEMEDGPKRSLVSFVVDAGDADCAGDEPVWHDGRVVGWITSGAFCHHVGKSLALGYVPAELAAADGMSESRWPSVTSPLSSPLLTVSRWKFSAIVAPQRAPHVPPSTLTANACAAEALKPPPATRAITGSAWAHSAPALEETHTRTPGRMSAAGPIFVLEDWRSFIPVGGNPEALRIAHFASKCAWYVHIGLMPANFTTFAHFSVSLAMNLANSAGVIDIGSTPRSLRRTCIFGSATTAVVSLLSFAMISVDVFLGAPMPNHPLAS
jgi:glycine cleavage system aminomethyltransferase T